MISLYVLEVAIFVCPVCGEYRFFHGRNYPDFLSCLVCPVVMIPWYYWEGA